MTGERGGYQIRPFSAVRQITVEGGRMAAQRHPIHGLIEVDVTHPRQLLQNHKTRTGETFSFTAFILFCLARAIEDHKPVQAYRDWRGRLVIFDDVDVNLMVEVEVEGRKVPAPFFVRAANRKSAREIHDAIRAFQSSYRRSGELKGLRLFAALPGLVRRAFYTVVFRNPFWLKSTFGTVGLTAVGMFGRGGGWAIPFMMHSLDVALGGIARKPGLGSDDRIEIRECLNVTVSFDHDVIDGAPAARFTQRFRELVESGCGLDNL
ncbi:MAG: 2-oxo acid dehydrogenase subunit E2 [Chloroflexi bacterium]|nr:2-oxo acid dehydrogenase subunit E2 [Chloroflexota bacterium]